MTLVPENDLRKSTINLFYDMIEVEHKFRANFKQVEYEFIDKLDILVSENKGDAAYRHLFQTM